MSPTAFRDRVVVALKAEFPNRSFTLATDPNVLKCGTTEFGLQNLRARFLTSDNQNEATLRLLVKEHFSSGLATMDPADSHALTWEAAREVLRPQLMPAEYHDRMPLASKPFAKGVLQGFVIDEPNTYSYVLKDDLSRWGVTIEQLDSVALENLEAISEGISLQASTGSDSYLAVGGADGYDAVRILSPRLRAFAAQRLGSPFFAAIPNRDFLIMWSAKASAAFQSQAREQAFSDCRDQPYPLTAAIFEVTPTEIRPSRRP